MQVLATHEGSVWAAVPWLSGVFEVWWGEILSTYPNAGTVNPGMEWGLLRASVKR
jgi:hypothetical protein